MSGIYGIGQAFKSIFGLKEGGAVPVSLPEKRSPFMQALHDNYLKIAGGGGIHYRKKGGVVKKTKAKKGKKKGKDKK